MPNQSATVSAPPPAWESHPGVAPEHRQIASGVRDFWPSVGVLKVASSFKASLSVL